MKNRPRQMTRGREGRRWVLESQHQADIDAEAGELDLFFDVFAVHLGTIYLEKAVLGFRKERERIAQGEFGSRDAVEGEVIVKVDVIRFGDDGIADAATAVDRDGHFSTEREVEHQPGFQRDDK